MYFRKFKITPNKFYKNWADIEWTPPHQNEKIFYMLDLEEKIDNTACGTTSLSQISYKKLKPPELLRKPKDFLQVPPPPCVYVQRKVAWYINSSTSIQVVINIAKKIITKLVFLPLLIEIIKRTKNR